MTEVSFDEADIRSTFRVLGHPGVVGIYLDAYSEGDTIAVDDLPSIDISAYEVPYP